MQLNPICTLDYCGAVIHYRQPRGLERFRWASVVAALYEQFKDDLDKLNDSVEALCVEIGKTVFKSAENIEATEPGAEPCDVMALDDPVAFIADAAPEIFAIIGDRLLKPLYQKTGDDEEVLLDTDPPHSLPSSPLPREAKSDTDSPTPADT